MARSSAGPVVHFWRTDRGLSVLLTALVTVIFIMPTLVAQEYAHRTAIQVAFQCAFMLVFVAGVTASAPGRGTLVATVLVVAAAIVMFWVHHVHRTPTLGAWRAGTTAIATALLAVLVLRRVFQAGPITLDRVRGAVAVYLLIGLTWGNVYQLIEYLSPGAFHLPEPVESPIELAGLLGYYSFVTLTTIGYGDVVPVHPAARSAAVLEGLVGQLFPAVLLARLVAMELSAHAGRR